MTIHDRGFAELTTRQFHDIVQLRVDVFVVEQDCPYPELDGRDHEPMTRHIWTSDDRGVTSYVRVMADPGETRIGRVVTRETARGEGLARQLLDHVLATTDGPWMLHAQSHLADWYGDAGFVIEGDEFLEDDIPHVTMRRSV